MTVRDNTALSRFELDVGDAVAFANYRRAPGNKVVAGCGFVVDYLHKHPEFSDLAR